MIECARDYVLAVDADESLVFTTQASRATLHFDNEYFIFNNANGGNTKLNIEQFLNFHDIISNSCFYGSFPLGHKLWFNLRTLSFSSSKASSDFRFTRYNWYTYLRRAHWKALALILERKHENYQLNEDNEASLGVPNRPYNVASQIGRQTLPWETSNAYC